MEFDLPIIPNVITTPIPNHGKCVNAIEDTIFVSSFEDLTIPLTFVKKNLLRVGVFPGCLKDCDCCAEQVNGCKWQKEGVQRMMNSHEILFERTMSIKSLTDKIEDLSIITILNKPLRISSKGPIRISNELTVAPLIITARGPISYSSNKEVSWNYDAEVLYHGIKQYA